MLVYEIRLLDARLTPFHVHRFRGRTPREAFRKASRLMPRDRRYRGCVTRGRHGGTACYSDSRWYQI